MLNIGRMAPGRADYYLTAVARGGDDGVEGYYLAPGEEPGRWLGAGAHTLALTGEVTADDLHAVLDGRDPTTGDQLAAHPARKVPGFDHTFRAPKSVSLLWALGERDTAAEVVAAHDAVVDAAIGYLERAAGFTRRGAGGAETVKADGFVAAAFRHRSSRANDPLLHTHVLVANLARTSDDGVWRTLDSRKVFAHAKTAGVLYQAQLRCELTRRLGVAWGPVVNGHADIEGVERELIEAFSRRRAAIVEHMAARGETSAAAAQAATLATRTAKTGHPSEAQLRAAWQARAAAVGLDARWVAGLVERASWERPDLGGLYRTLVVEEGLTEQTSTFTRRDVLQQLAGRLPAGAPVAYLEEAADAVIARDPDLLVALGTARGQLTGVDVIRRTDGRLVPVDPNERRYTTRGLLLTEQRAINRTLDRQDAGIGAVEAGHFDAAVRRRTLTDEQQTMVRRLTASGAGVEVVVGKAGTGKTYALDAARETWEAAGIRVTGAALAARAALELQESSGIRSTTLARLLGQLEDGRPGASLAPGSVLVVDEAGMVGTRQLARLLDHAEQQQVKVVLVGDPKQLPEIDAGGLFRALATRLPAIELTDNRRQHLKWEQAALDELRHGSPATALAAYGEHDRIHVADTPEQLRDRLVDDWWTTASEDLSGSLMVALRRSDVDDLNHRARARMLTAGRLTGPTLQAGDLELQVGDRIVCLRNERRIGVVNGTRATVTDIDPARRAVRITDDRGGQFVLPAEYLDAGHVAHGYAITGHKAQGLTCDHTYVLGSETLYREWGYVALSRGRLTNQLYHGPPGDDDGLHHHVHIDDQPHDLSSRLERTRAEEPVSPEVAELAERWREVTAQIDALDLPRQQALLDHREQLAGQRGSLDSHGRRLQQQTDHASGGLRRLRARRTVEDLQDRLHEVTARVVEVTEQLARVDRQLERFPSPAQVADLFQAQRQLETALHQAAAARVRGLGQEPAAYLTAELGRPPRDGWARDRWLKAATAIEEHRLRWGITSPAWALGPVGGHPRRDASRDRLTEELARARAELRQGPIKQHRRVRGL